jgi:hypothetical protein
LINHRGHREHRGKTDEQEEFLLFASFALVVFSQDPFQIFDSSVISVSSVVKKGFVVKTYAGGE